jgi:hypothetical protein
MAKRKVTPKKTAEKKEQWRESFLSALEDSGRVDLACKAAGIARQTAYRHRQEDPEFAAQWDASKAVAIELLEDEAFRRAYEGTEKPVYQRGVLVGGIQEYSDTLLIFLLKAHKPDKYRETVRQEHTGKDGEPLVFNLSFGTHANRDD